MILDRDVDTNGENEKETGFPFKGLLAMMSYRSLPEDYWEKKESAGNNNGITNTFTHRCGK